MLEPVYTPGKAQTPEQPKRKKKKKKGKSQEQSYGHSM